MFVPLSKVKFGPAEAPEPRPEGTRKKWGITLGRGHAVVTLLVYTAASPAEPERDRAEAEALLRDLAIGLGNDLQDWAYNRGELVFYQVAEAQEPPYADLEHR